MREVTKMSNNQAKPNNKQAVLVYPTSRRCTKPVINTNETKAATVETAAPAIATKSVAVERAS